MVTPGPADLARHLYQIESRADAEAAIRQGGAILLILGVVLLASLPWIQSVASSMDRAAGALLYLLIGGLIYARHSRIAAILALLLAGVTTFAVFHAIHDVRAFAGYEARKASMHVFYVVAFFGALRSIQGTLLLYARHLTTSVRWRKLVQLWIVVFLYTTVAFWGAAALTVRAEASEVTVVFLSLSAGGIVFFLGCLRWMPFTKNLAVLKNETDDLDALPF